MKITYKHRYSFSKIGARKANREKNEQNLQINLSSVLNEANARMIEGEKVQEVKEREQFLIKEMSGEKQAEK